MSTKIVLIDDDLVQARKHASELQAAGFHVEVINTQKGYAKFRRKLGSAGWNSVSLFLVDVMMPPEKNGQRYNVSLTQDGLITGIFVARDLREAHKSTPIILWSTAPFDVVATAARSSAKTIPACAFIRKQEGVETVKSMFAHFGKYGVLSSVWRKLNFDPSGAGTQASIKIGIDLFKAAMEAFLKSRIR